MQQLKNPEEQDIQVINKKLQPFFCRTTKKQLLVPEANGDAIIVINASEQENKLFNILRLKYSKNKLALIIRLLQLESNPSLLLETLDISEFAVEQATENAKRNSLSDTVTFRAANVLDELPKLAAAGEKYDVVILDPPAFTKSRQATKNAIKGYREINMKGLKLVKDGGYLATCSCSHFMTQELLAKTIREAARATHKRLRQVEFRTQAADHPILWAAEESYYLKFFIFQVVDEK